MELPRQLDVCAQIFFHVFPPALPSAIDLSPSARVTAKARSLSSFPHSGCSYFLWAFMEFTGMFLPHNFSFFFTFFVTSVWKGPGELMLLKQHRFYHQQDK